MLAALFSLIAASASVTSLLIVRQIKRDHEAAVAALKPLADGLAAANKVLNGG